MCMGLCEDGSEKQRQEEREGEKQRQRVLTSARGRGREAETERERERECVREFGSLCRGVCVCAGTFVCIFFCFGLGSVRERARERGWP